MGLDHDILLIEDDIIETMKMRRVFAKLNIQNTLHVCKNGQEGLTWLEENPYNFPSLIILDLNMPLMDGIEFLKTIKHDDKWCAIPVVVFSTSNNPSDIRECYRNHVAGYFVKPLDYYEYERQVGILRAYWEASTSIPV
jgi:CheY-like chemotaxis protein